MIGIMYLRTFFLNFVTTLDFFTDIQTHTEFREFDGPWSVDVNFVDHVLNLSIRRILSEGSHDRGKLLQKERMIVNHMGLWLILLLRRPWNTKCAIVFRVSWVGFIITVIYVKVLLLFTSYCVAQCGNFWTFLPLTSQTIFTWNWFC